VTLAISIRAARHDELDDIDRITVDADQRFTAAGHPELADGETMPRTVAERAVAEGRILVAELDGTPVGWVYLGRIGDEPCIGHLAVAQRHGLRGIGSALVRAAIALSRARGAGSIVLSTQRDVAFNEPFFARHGFVAIAPRDWSPAQHAVAAAQASAGLDVATRAFMRRAL
jgi:4-diphosphocytidyl-2-C-methyl-D-erythritol kinase